MIGFNKAFFFLYKSENINLQRILQVLYRRMKLQVMNFVNESAEISRALLRRLFKQYTFV